MAKRRLGRVGKNKAHMFEKSDTEELWSSICLNVYEHVSLIKFIELGDDVPPWHLVPFCSFCRKRLERERG